MNRRMIAILFFSVFTLISWAQNNLTTSFDLEQIIGRMKSDACNMVIDRCLADNYRDISPELPTESDSLQPCEVSRLVLIMKAHQYLGVKYRYGHASKNGFDCSGYVKYVFSSFGMDLPHSSYGQYKLCRKIKQEEARAGDLVFFITRGNGISHVGIYIGDNRFIHSPGRGDTVSINTLEEGYYRRHLAGFGSILES